MTDSAHRQSASLSGPRKAAMNEHPQTIAVVLSNLRQLQQAGTVSLNREGGAEYVV